jgi:cell division protein FtsZ
VTLPALRGAAADSSQPAAAPAMQPAATAEAPARERQPGKEEVFTGPEVGVPAPRQQDAQAMPGSADGQHVVAGHAGRSDSQSTRRRSVVFEEDDELDVPDFLK